MLSWAALAAAVLLVPGVQPARARAFALAGHGRLRPRDNPATARGAALPAWLPPVACLAAAVPVGLVGGPALAVTALVAALTALGLSRAATRRRHRDRVAAELFAAVTLMAAELEAGASPATAVRAGAEVCPTSEGALRALAARVETGDDPTDDPAATSGADPPELAFLAQAWQLANTTGAPLAEVWSRVARDLAQRIEQRRAVATALAGARASAALLAVLPVVGLLLGTAMQAAPVHVLLATPTGHVALLIGVCLDAAGLGWTHWLAARAEGP